MDLHYYFNTEFAKAQGLGLSKNFIIIYKHFRRTTQNRVGYTVDDSKFHAMQKAVELANRSSVVRVYDKYNAVFFGRCKEHNNRKYLQVFKPDGHTDYVHEKEIGE